MTSGGRSVEDLGEETNPLSSDRLSADDDSAGEKDKFGRGRARQMSGRCGHFAAGML